MRMVAGENDGVFVAAPPPTAACATGGAAEGGAGGGADMGEGETTGNESL